MEIKNNGENYFNCARMEGWICMSVIITLIHCLFIGQHFKDFRSNY